MALVAVLLLVYIAVVSAVHVVQGTAGIGISDLWQWAIGQADAQTDAVIVDSRLPRVAAGFAIGAALGCAGAMMTSFARNVLASPDTLAVNESAFLMLTIAAVVGIQPGRIGEVGLAFAGGLAGAALVVGLAGTGYRTVRLILAGIAMTLVFDSLATTLMIVNPLETRGLYAWSAGSLAQTGYEAVRMMAPLVVLSLAASLLLARRLDIMMLGDDEATSLGVPVRRTQLYLLLISVLLSAAAVTVVGPIGFIGLVAPAVVRLLAGRIAGLHRHHFLIPASGLLGVALVLTADVVLRAILGSQESVEVPTGVMSSLLGAVAMAALATKLRASSLGVRGDTLEILGVGVRRPLRAVAGAAALVAAVAYLALLAGDRMLLPGDLVVWATGEAGPIVGGVMSARLPRVAAALLAGIALAVAGVLVQGVTRNPLADTSIIGISGGAAVGAVVVVTFFASAGFWTLALAADAGALVAAAVVFGLSARGGLENDRLILIGVAMAFFTAAVVTLLIVATDPWNETKALTWLSGSTYGRSFEHLVPLAVGCLLLLPAAMAGARQLDLLSVDDDVPVVLGVRVARARLLLLVCAVLLTALSVAGIGLVVFVGLVAPHAARTLVGRRHRWVLPVAALLGAALVVCADMLGRTVVAPIQLPATLLTSCIGAPYFFWLMYRGRRGARGA
jgi:ABC-type Fe3+-siderophore transport system permease subunit